ncbi:MAG: nickel-dependent hydrogenase large subunit [Methanomicrobiales archaeon]|nr:nickel-dependent hydrogenase large subunit [Methanomicrobiales archaeon]MDI6877180.1 nickel-dependent hydrogenase large subunit [Methanomicrobiales archaeon]
MAASDRKKKSLINVPIGPAHPALKEPVQFTFQMDGERIEKVDYAPGQAHRGIEWMGMRRNPIRTLYLSERICGICGISHSFALCQAVEKIAGIEVPERAQYIRTIIAELERIHSHLLWAGVAAHELGFDSLLFLSWREREDVMDLLEYISGNRVNYGMNQFGGVRRDITPEQYPRVRQSLEHYRSIFDHLATLFLKDTTIQLRTRDTGILTKEDALRLCAVGPSTRASGVKKDVRQDFPYAAYADLDVHAITPDELTGEVRGDVYDRIVVRLLEVAQSVEIIDQCLKDMPEGEILAERKIPKLLATLRKAKGEAIGRVEAPRGEDMHYVRMAGKEPLDIWKVKASTYSNIMSWVPMLEGEQIADIPIVVASIDPCLSCTDRVAIVQDGRKEILTRDDLHRLSVEKTRRLERCRS